jgi:hypothetical protein
MEPTLIRMLSTGRVGTKFVAAAFADQGYQAFHENLYEGEPSSAIIQYVRMLGDLWKGDKDRYFSLQSDFARPYLDAVLENRDIKKNGARSILKSIFRQPSAREFEPVVIHTGHRLTAATPLIEREAKKRGLSVKTLILFRNPLKTIHAIFTVESPSSALGGPYHNWPSSFFSDAGFNGAAEIWANTYLMAHDQMIRLAANEWRFLSLETFNSNENYVKKVFDFLGLQLNSGKFNAFVKRIASQPLRSSKTDSERNSDIFHNAKFYFSDQQITEIYSRVKETISVYELDWQQIVQEYKAFHEQEKQQIGFAKA